MSTSFDGFSRELPRFLRLLARNNEKAWSDSHRADYDDYYVEAAKGSVAAIGPALRKLTPGLVAEPRVNGAIMRINRDIRFAKDKTPYKTALHLIFTLEGGKALRSCIEKVKSARGPIELGGETAKRVPRGFDPDHQNADLLRHKGIHLGSDEPLPEPLFDERAVTYCMERFRVLRSLLQWLDRNVA